jgi:hypothetical protein
MPKVLAILLVYLAALALNGLSDTAVFPPIVHDIEGPGHKAAALRHDFEAGPNNNKQFQTSTRSTTSPRSSARRRRTSPPTCPAGEHLGSFTVSCLEHLLAAITSSTLTFFLLSRAGNGRARDRAAA